ncbi:hypothetical protein BKC07_04625 [Peribacillus simplex]|nr:hypothetical protein BKC07_04625 [Peribacillus simplex]
MISAPGIPFAAFFPQRPPTLLPNQLFINFRNHTRGVDGAAWGQLVREHHLMKDMFPNPFAHSLFMA